MKHTVSYTEKNDRKVLVTRTKWFDDVASACSFVKEIKGKSVTVPVMDTVEEGVMYIDRHAS